MIKVIKKVEKNELLDFFYDKMDKNDYQLYDELQMNPINIFQFQGTTATNIIKRVKPRNLSELSACNALSRPGTINFLDDYISCRNGESVKYNNPLIAACLEETFTVILYQEQIMQLFNKIGGFSLEETNYIRSLLKKLGKAEKKQSDVEDWKKSVNRFMENATKLGIEEEEVSLLVEDMEGLAQYSFNKSHALCYTAFAVITLYFSRYLKSSWYSAAIEYKMNTNRDDMFEIFSKISENGYIINKPDINKSKEKTFTTKNEIFLGLGNIKGVGLADSIIVNNAPYDSFIDFYTKNSLESQVNKRVVMALVKLGAFDELEDLGRPELIETVLKFWDKKKTFKKDKRIELLDVIKNGDVKNYLEENTTQVSRNKAIWDNLKEDALRMPKIKITNQYLKEKEFEGLGFNFFVSSISNKLKKDLLEKEKQGLLVTSFNTLKELENVSRPMPVVITGIVEKKDRNNNLMAFLIIEDIYSSKAKIPIFSSIYPDIKDKLTLEKPYLMLLYSTFSDFTKSLQIQFGTKRFVTKEKARRFIIPLKEE